VNFARAFYKRAFDVYRTKTEKVTVVMLLPISN